VPSPHQARRLGGGAQRSSLRDRGVGIAGLRQVPSRRRPPGRRGSDSRRSARLEALRAELKLKDDEALFEQVGLGERLAPVIAGVTDALELALRAGVERAMDVYNRSGALGCEELP
jgi:hypothetical protein